MITTDGHSANANSAVRGAGRRSRGLLSGWRRIAAGLALGFALIAAFIALLLGGSAGPHEDLVRSDEGRLYALSMQTLASRQDAAGIQDVCDTAESVLAGGTVTYVRDWELLAPLCVEAQTARTSIEWTQLQIKLRRVSPF